MNTAGEQKRCRRARALPFIPFPPPEQTNALLLDGVFLRFCASASCIGISKIRQKKLKVPTDLRAFSTFNRKRPRHLLCHDAEITRVRYCCSPPFHLERAEERGARLMSRVASHRFLCELFPPKAQGTGNEGSCFWPPTRSSKKRSEDRVEEGEATEYLGCYRARGRVAFEPWAKVLLAHIHTSLRVDSSS